jgi:hypothetical protein
MRTKDTQESVMVSQCANPDCRRELRYVRDGKIYAFAVSTGNGSKSLEHFWPCGECSKKMTLTCLSPSEVRIARRREVTQTTALVMGASQLDKRHQLSLIDATQEEEVL